MTGEFDLIARIKQQAGAVNAPGLLLGIGDDAAIIQLPADEQMVISTDSMNVGVHFLPSDRAADIGHKIIAVNLSDLAAMAATPRWLLLNLTLPAEWSADRRADWVEELLTGMAALLHEHKLQLIGGDTSSGPLALTITALGSVPAAAAVLRSGARVGDHVLVSGSIGDAAAALQLSRQQLAVDPRLLQRLQRPLPRVQLGLRLRTLASAMIDISDGLLADLQHMLVASGVGAEIHTERLPQSSALQAAAMPADQKLACMLSGGDDYELCCCVPEQQLQLAMDAAAQFGIALTDIGSITAGTQLRCVDAQGQVLTADKQGWEHFAA